MALMVCPECGGKVSTTVKACPHCGYTATGTPAAPPTNAPVAAPTRQWSPGIAAVLSLVIPGAGQMYKGKVGVGLLWLVAVVIGYTAMIVPGIILHLVCIFNAASGQAK
jgi:TM2 domain-containing membrane protein YozV